MPSEIPENLIADASILFSFFKVNSSRRDVFKRLLEQECKLSSPDFVSKELSSNKPDIMKFAKINEGEFDDVMSELNNDLGEFKKSEYEKFLPEANKISPHGKGTKDDPYFALALAFNFPIWSDEAAFKLQSRVRVFTTAELLKLLEEPSDKPAPEETSDSRAE